MKKILFTALIFLLTTLLLVQADIVTNLTITEALKTTVSVGDIPIEIAVNLNTNRIYSCNLSSNSLSVINGKTQTLITNVNVGESPRSVAINTMTNTIYVANKGSNSVSVINGETNTVTSTISVEQSPFGIAVNLNTNKVYVSNESSNTVSVIDGSSNSVIKSISVGEAPEEVIVNVDKNKIYVANTNSNTASVIDGTSDSVIKTIEGVGESPTSWTQDEDRNKLYLLSFSGSLFEIDPNTDSVVNNFAAGGDKALDLAFHPTTKKIYVTNLFNSTVFVFDAKNNVPLYDLNFIHDPTGIAINGNTNAIYIADQNRSQISVVEDAQAKIKIPEENNNTGMSSSGGTTLTNTLTPEDVQEFYDALDEINDARKELTRASKFARSIAIKISAQVRKIKSILNKPTEECKSLLGSTLPKLAEVINSLGNKSCETSNSKKCVPADIASEFTLRFEEAYGELDATFHKDIDSSKSPDVCEVKPE